MTSRAPTAPSRTTQRRRPRTPSQPTLSNRPRPPSRHSPPTGTIRWRRSTAESPPTRATGCSRLRCPERFALRKSPRAIVLARGSGEMRRRIREATALAACAAGVAALAAPPALGAGPVAGAARVGAVPAGQRLGLVFPLKADDAGLAAFARAVSTPGSPLYGQYESVQTLAGRFGASSATSSRVLAYLRARGARDARIDPTGLLAEATMNAVEAQRLFQTHLARFRARGAAFVAPESSVTVPAPLRGLVNGVVGLDPEPVLHGAPARRPVHRPAARAASAQPSSEVPITGTPSGCPAGVGSQGFTPNQYMTA